MKLPINNKVYFDSITHSYVRESDGKYLSGVTGLMRKHGLSTDYLGIPEHILKMPPNEEQPYTRLCKILLTGWIIQIVLISQVRIIIL